MSGELTFKVVAPPHQGGHQVKARRRRLLVAFAIPLALLGLLAIVQNTTDWSFTELLDDPYHTVEGAHPLHSTGTTLYVLGWAVPIGACLVGYAVSRHKFFLAVAGLAAFLLADDAWALHDYWSPVYIAAGDRGEKLVIGLEMLTVGAIVWRWRKVWPQRNLSLLAGAMFTASVLFDRVPGEWHVYADDGFKILGLGVFAAWSLTIVVDHIKDMVQRPPVLREVSGSAIRTDSPATQAA
jgi:hypothetical protein